MSLQAQREAIERYAAHNGLSIRAWFEETETAARRGRPAFGEMLARLEAGDARGVVIHKIDRGARNLRDWADLAELVDRGLEIHFANENLDLRSRGGRLSADIQAVVAADFIRNLREETRKGFYGRLRQGLYPLPAPIGYLNRGRGQPKEVDPERAPLVREAFVLYASGRHTLDTLRRELRARGYGRRDGGALSRNCLSLLLTNPFYAGVIRLRVTGETFPGIHERLVSPTLFARVQSLLVRLPRVLRVLRPSPHGRGAEGAPLLPLSFEGLCNEMLARGGRGSVLSASPSHVCRRCEPSATSA